MFPDSKVHGANMGPTWALSTPDGPHVGPMKLVIRVVSVHCGDQRHAGLCLGYVPALAFGSCRASDQGTTLRASDLHNARANILNPFYNMEYKITKKIRQNMTWIGADIPGVNLTPNRYNRHSPQPLSTSAMTSQSYSTPWRHNSTWMGPKSLWNLRIDPRTYRYFFMYKG